MPAYRGRGIGEKLSQALLETVEAKGAKVSFLTVHPNNARALDIYKRLGFVEQQSVPDYYGDEVPRLIIVEVSGLA